MKFLVYNWICKNYLDIFRVVLFIVFVIDNVISIGINYVIIFIVFFLKV